MFLREYDMNVLITGSSGFLGKHVAEKFNWRGYKVYGVSRAPVITDYNQYALDVNDFDGLNKIVSERDIEIIIHTAGKPVVQDCERNPYDAYKVNGLGTASVLEAARLNNVKKVISIETDKVYGYQEEIPTNETAIPNPKSPYEFSKVLASEFAQFYRDYYGLEVISVRPANLFGPWDYSTSRIIPKALQNLKKGKGIRLYDTALDMKRDFVYVEDAAEAIYKLASQECKHNTYNISANEPIKIKDLADKIVNTLGLNIPHDIVKKEGDFAEIPLQEIDGARFKDEFNFNFTPFETAIKDTWEKEMNDEFITTTLEW